MTRYNFDTVINRHNTQSVKFDGLKELFGRTDLVPLWVADMDFEVCPEISEALQRRIAHHIYGYAVADDSYWQSIIDWQQRRNNFSFSREEVTYVPGVVKAIGFAVNYFTRPGDTVVIQPPVYHPFRIVTEGNGRKVAANPLIRHGDTFSMDFNGLEQIFAYQHPKLMILCNPHNPIGITWNKDTLVRLARLCKQYGVLVISDEIHGDLAMFGNRFTPFATCCDEAAQNSVVFGAPSKTFNIPGLVSSWTVVKNPDIRRGFFQWLEANEFDAPTFVATVATEAAYNHGEEWLEQAKAYIEDNIRFIEQYCNQYIPLVHPIRPEASFLVWLDCSALNLCHDALVDTFINKAHLALNDGEIFGAEGAGCMRLNVATARSVIADALEKLRLAL
ncbi:MAG: MalY/PatB family protein [Muribaculaceae bacterium]|nr:MalY/PatB family protein [Muribaculaceae bacterium]